MATILQSPFVVELVLPFLLVFAVVFAVLQKSKVLGEGKRQIDAIVSLAIALIVVAFTYYVKIIVELTAFLGLILIILLVVMMILGMVGKGDDHEKTFPGWFKKWGAGVSIAAVVIALVFITGAWKNVADFVSKNGNSDWIYSLITLAIVVVAVFLVYRGAKTDSSGGK
jgi:hypothetical protein